MKNTRCYLLFSIFSCYGVLVPIASYDALPKAIVIAPVADIIRRSLQEVVPAEKVYHAYHLLGYRETDEQDPYERAYQLLFNEEVGVVACRGDEVMVQVPHLYHKEHKGAIEQRYYWMLKDVLAYVDDLREACVDCSKLPPPIKASYTDLGRCNQNVVTLVMPYTDPRTQVTYSAGTRFMRAAQHNNDETLPVYVLNGNTLLYDIVKLPRAICLTYQHQSKPERMRAYISLLQRWSNCQQGVVPYVWGGASFTHYVAGNSSWEQCHQCGAHVAQTFESYPYAGFDCSCLIWRAALAVGIPYFFGNSDTMHEHMRALTTGDTIRAGDILWFQGHVMVVGNIQDNTVIEARGYGSGFGRLQELPLSTMFGNIATYAELEEACFNHKPVILLHRDGSVRLVIKELKVLSFQASW